MIIIEIDEVDFPLKELIYISFQSYSIRDGNAETYKLKRIIKRNISGVYPCLTLEDKNIAHYYVNYNHWPHQTYPYWRHSELKEEFLLNMLRSKEYLIETSFCHPDYAFVPNPEYFNSDMSETLDLKLESINKEFKKHRKEH